MRTSARSTVFCLNAQFNTMLLGSYPSEECEVLPRLEPSTVPYTVPANLGHFKQRTNHKTDNRGERNNCIKNDLPIGTPRPVTETKDKC